jgi:hypothetical protein
MITLHKEDKVFFNIHFDKTLQCWIMHMDCQEWSPSVYKRYKKIWENKIIPHLKRSNIKEVYGLCEDLKAVKFNKLFGVIPTGEIVTTDDSMEQILVRRVL